MWSVVDDGGAAADMHVARCAVADRAEDPRSGSYDTAHRTIVGQLKQLKPWTMISMLALVVLIVALGAWHWQLMLVSLFLLVPTLGQLVRWWKSHPEACPLDHVLASFAHGLFVLSIAAMASGLVAAQVSIAVVSPLLSLFWTSSLWRLGVTIQMFIFWGVFCFIEELWSVSTLRAAKARRAHYQVASGQRIGAHALYASASAVGYATAQCILLSCLVTAIMEGHTAFELHEENAGDSEITLNETGWLFALALIFAWFWLPLRLLSSHLHVLTLAKFADATTDPADRNCILDTLCPLPAAPSSNEEKPCSQRLTHLARVVRWSWGLRAAHLIQFTVWFYLLAVPLTLSKLFLWLAVVFACWTAIVIAALRLIRNLESEIDPQASAEASNLRALYGFSLLSNEEEATATVDII